MTVMLALVAWPAVAAAPCNCVPTTHQVRIPGIVVEAPVVNSGTGWSLSGGTGSAEASANAGVSANVSVSTQVSVSGNLGQASSAAANLIASGGGGSTWNVESGQVSSVPILDVDVTSPAQRVCASYSAPMHAMRIAANCIDDKGVPHPASQTSPDRSIPERFEGEVYRCIAGARLQYTVSELTGGAGRTLTCEKGEALYLSNSGQLTCKPQIPARDCNERSLLRRFGPGEKQAHLAATPVCRAWRESDPGMPTAGEMTFDGGVGGIAR